MLLEAKHLYQKVTIDVSSIASGIRRHIKPQDAARFNYFDTAIAEFAAGKFAPAFSPLLAVQRVGPDTPIATLVLKNVKLYCTQCESSEVYQPIWFTDAATEALKRNLPGAQLEIPLKDNFQLVFLVFQCQRCKSDPEGFLLRRAGHSLTLEGRSPIESVPLITAIPKLERHFLSDALIAHNAGKTLAALFYLRTFLEQFARRVTGIVDRITGDELMDKYGASLPIQHRDHMPSFREWYDKLSEALHLARADAALFEKAREEVERHFEIRRVFKIPEALPLSE